MTAERVRTHSKVLRPLKLNTDFACAVIQIPSAKISSIFG